MPRFVLSQLTGDADIVGLGGPLTPDTLYEAYRQGIFPWPMSGYPLLWFSPIRRAALDFDHLHIPKSLARACRRSELTFTVDTAFDAVIAACRAARRPGQDGTWITPPMLTAYRAFHRAGYAHSVEAWDKAGTLVGGLYGVCVGGVFSGESMFHHVPNASKLALLHLIEYLRSRGLTWMDIQMMTPHMQALGAREIPRAEFLDRLEVEQARSLTLFA